MTTIEGKTVLITGAASGIGRLLAEAHLAKRAKQVVLWDINEAALNQTANQLARRGFKVHPYVVDVSQAEDINWAAKDVLANVGTVDILYNNAGIVVGKPFVAHSDAEMQRTIDINLMGVMRVARAFLPAMVAQQSGCLVNMASAAGLIANPNMSVYAASKWAVIGWSESVRLEMEAISPQLQVLTVMPSYINTGMFEGVKAPLLTPILEPADVVRRILEAVEKGETELKAPFIVGFIPLLKGLLPKRLFDYVAGRLLGVYGSMDTFKGRAAAESSANPNIF